MSFNFRHLLLIPLACIALAKPNEDPPTPLPAPLPPAVQPAPEQADDALSELESQAGSRFTQDIMLQALGLIGVTYRWGGSTPESGLDCSGFIRYVFQQSLNIALPHNAFAISRLGEDVGKEALKPGDLVFFNTLGRKFSHVGIYLGDDRFIHSPRKGSKVQVVRITDAYWAKRYNGGRRVTHESVAERSQLAGKPVQEAEKVETSKKGHKKSRKSAKKKPSTKSSGKKSARKKHG
ncbi:C40 family peptidase [Chitinimonas sp. BJB300]|uniref:C40 family peptidase n=1 Tax=Chitinimonas sp. BJB300 TaxID=1559339 RepID=UPI000C0E89F6|nr:C40 family peptidase [Chitinimonas sp. BJB300]PHV12967.1 glycoside hydrolase [Chitinimonas sp. BJB300]TSJ89080.1 NlpC/P60 family protein [Chitinimonas sp. BJB300]